jgi:hypothetical protein
MSSTTKESYFHLKFGTKTNIFVHVFIKHNFLLWFWLFLVAVLTFFNFFAWIFYCVFQDNKARYVKKYLKITHEFRDAVVQDSKFTITITITERQVSFLVGRIGFFE